MRSRMTIGRSTCAPVSVLHRPPASHFTDNKFITPGMNETFTLFACVLGTERGFIIMLCYLALAALHTHVYNPPTQNALLFPLSLPIIAQPNLSLGRGRKSRPNFPDNQQLLDSERVELFGRSDVRYYQSYYAPSIRRRLVPLQP